MHNRKVDLSLALIMQPSGSDASEREYILVINGKPEGPFTIEKLKELNIKPGDFVKTAAMDDYKEAHEVAELRQLFGFEKRPLPLQYFGSFDQRLLASAIDWFIVSGGFILLAFVSIWIVQDKMTRVIVSVSILALIPVANIIYHVLLESSVKQATIGKQLLKIRVTDTNGERITTAKALSRNLAKILSTATFFVGYIISFFNKKQQCLHDMIANTLVIKDRL